MAGRSLAGSLALTGDWPLGDSGWKDDNDTNLLWLSVLVQGRVLEQVAALPGAPTQGMVYLLAATHATHPNQVAVYDEAAWHYKTPLTGWSLYNVALGAFVRFDGSIWAVDDSGSSAGTIADGVVSGCALVYTGTGFTFALTAGTFYLGGQLYSAPAQTITLDAADALLPRVDTIFVYGSGVVGKITGTPDADPAEPEVDTETQLFLMSVNVPAAATDLSSLISSELIYDEGTEWTPTVTGSAINDASTVAPYSGTESIEATAATGADEIRFVTGSPIAFDNSGNLIFQIKSKGFWDSGQINLFFYQGGRRKGNRVTLRDGLFGFDSSNTTTYQQIAIPKYRFAIPVGTGIDELRLSISAAIGIGFFLDGLALQTPDATGITIVTTTTGLTREQADALYAPLITVENVGGATYTFLAADVGGHKRFTGGAAVAATVPPDVFSKGDRVRITQAGAGQVTLVAGAGVTLHSRDAALKSAGQYAVFEIECVGSNEFDVLGDVTV